MSFLKRYTLIPAHDTHKHLQKYYYLIINKLVLFILTHIYNFHVCNTYICVQKYKI